MAADTTLTIYGSGHLVGKTARLVLCGLDAGLYTVQTDGSVVFTYGGDPGGIITPSYLVANPSPGTDHDVSFTVFDGTANRNVTIPVLVGIDFTAKGQLIRPLTEQTMQAGPGAGLGKTRRAAWAAFLVRDLFAMKAGTNFSNMYSVSVTTDGGITPELVIAADAPYTGVQVHLLDDAESFDGQLAWQSVGPSPLVIGAAGAFIEGASR